jgi:predicted signal transduction protein with EAL and GGDEF domain
VRALIGSIDVVARLGGDEFAVLQADFAGIETSLRLAAAITQALSEPYSLAGNEVHASASIGIAQCSTRVTDAETIMIQADLALYRAKEDGRKCIRLHSSDLDRQVHERVSLAEELRASLGRGDFELHYQPQVELASGRIVGMEALLRWNHPTRGMLAPGTFIGIAERTGLILPLGRWAFEEACRQLRLWLDAGVAPDTVAVNVSAVQIKHAPELQREIAESLTRWRIPRGAMEMELTESVLMDVTEQHSRLLQQLRQLGLQISIDDFGTGYSSLNYLTLHPINRLKIARELVSRVATDPRCATVVRATIRLAAELGIDLLAEGVEDARQASFLARAGCQDVQGYYFSRPVDARAATSLLRVGTIDVAERHHERAS